MAKRLSIFSLMAVLVAFSACGGPTTTTTTTVNVGGGDSTAPELTVTAPAAAETFLTNSTDTLEFAVAATATDASGIIQMKVAVNGGSAVTATGGTLSTNVTLAEGTNTLVVSAIDASSAFNTTSNTYMVHYTQTNAPVPSGWESSGTFAAAMDAFEVAGAGTATNGVDSAMHAVGSFYQHAFYTNSSLAVSAGDYIIIDLWAKNNGGTGDVTGSFAAINAAGETNVKYLLPSMTPGDGTWENYTVVYEIGSDSANDGVMTTAAVYGGFEVYDGSDLYVDQYKFGLASTMDVTDPVLTSIDSPTNGYEANRATGFSVVSTSSDDYGVAATYVVLEQGATYLTNSSPVFSSTDLSGFATGAATVYVWVEDYAGNTSSVLSVSVTLVDAAVTTVDLSDYDVAMWGNGADAGTIDLATVDAGYGAGLFPHDSYILITRGVADFATWDAAMVSDLSGFASKVVAYLESPADNFNGGDTDGAKVIQGGTTDVDTFLGTAHTARCSTLTADGTFATSTTTHGFFTANTVTRTDGYTHPVYIWEVAEDDTSELGDYNANYILFYIP